MKANISHQKNKNKLLGTSLVFAIATILVLSAISHSALAHQRGLFTIGGKKYLFVVGSMNEPVYVDDKSGVDFFCIYS